jgi:hypothetical protein
MKPNRRGAADLLTPIDPGAQNVPDYVAAGLEQLAAAAPTLWPIEQLARWPSVVDRVMAFRRQCDRPARAAGWDDLSLYGLHRRAPYANVAAMGAAFLAALNSWHVIGVGADAIAIVSPAGSRLKIYREPPDPDAVVAWSLVSDKPATRACCNQVEMSLALQS